MRILLSTAVLLLCACTSIAQSEKPALISDASAASHDELVSTLSAALGVTMVTLARDAFTRDSILFVEPTPARDAAGQRLSGRDLGAPEQFNLVKRGNTCVLVHARTNRRTALKQVHCRAL